MRWFASPTLLPQFGSPVLVSTVLYELYSRLDAEERRPRDGGYTAAAVQETTSSQKNGLFGAFRKLATDLSDPVLTAPGVPPPVYVPEESEQQQQRSTEGVLVEV